MTPTNLPLLIEIGVIGLLVILLILAVWLAKRGKGQSKRDHIPRSLPC